MIPFEDGSFLSDPYPILNTVREQTAIFTQPKTKTGQDVWILTRHDTRPDRLRGESICRVQPMGEGPDRRQPCRSERRLDLWLVHGRNPGRRADNRRDRLDGDPAAQRETRVNPTHVTFGWGLYHCIGAPLARLEVAVVLESLATRFPRAHLTTQPVHHRTFVIHGYEEVNVALV